MARGFVLPTGVVESRGSTISTVGEIGTTVAEGGKQ
jgi:hypothetical protein